MENDKIEYMEIDSPAKQAAAVLSEFLDADPEACNTLLNRRIATTKAVVNHPTIRISGTEDNPKIGMLGLLNGILEKVCSERVVVHMDEEKIVGFSSISTVKYDEQNSK